MTNKNRFQNKIKPGDYVIDCYVCNMSCWASESTELPPETGRGGLIVCPNCVDAIDYGLIPYTIEEDLPVPVARSAHYADDASAIPTPVPPINYDTTDPMNASPQEIQARKYAWEQQLYSNWNQIDFLNWEDWGTTG